MKKLLVLLICIACLLCSAALADYPMEGEFDLSYSVVDYYGTTSVVVRDYNTWPEMDKLAIPPEIGGNPVARVKLLNLDSRIQTVYSPEDVDFRLHQGDAEFLWVQYITYQEYLERGGEIIENATDNALVVTLVGECQWDTVTDIGSISEVDPATVALAEEICGYPLLVAGNIPTPVEEGSDEPEVETSEELDTDATFVTDGFTWRALNYEDGQRVNIIGFPEGQEIVVIPEYLDGFPVAEVYLEMPIAEGLTVYAPSEIWVYSKSNQKADFLFVHYADKEHTAWWDSTTAANMTDDQYAIIQIERVHLLSDGDSNSSYDDATLYASAIPATINGKQVIYDNVGRLINDLSAFQYVSYGSDSIKVIGVTLEPDQTILVVPPELDGKQISRIELNPFPEQLEVIYHHDDAWLSTESDVTVTTIEYVDYEYVNNNKDRFKNIVRDMGEDDLALYRVQRYTFSSGNSSGYSTAYPADQLLTEINGQKLWNSLSLEYLAYEHEGVTYYYYNDEQTQIGIIDMDFTVENGTVMIPSNIDGKLVSAVDLNFLGEFDELIVLCPNSAWVDRRGAIDTLHVFKYTDRFYREFHGYDIYTNTAYLYSDTPTIGLTNYYLYEFGTQTDGATIEYSAIPTSYGDVVLKNCIASDYLTTYTHGDYTYVKLSDTECAIIKYNNEYSTNVIVPSKLDGLTVTAILGNLDRGDYVFYSSEIVNLELPATLTVLGDNAIYCSNLKTIKLPSGLTEIGSRAFAYMSYKANALTLPEGLTKLGTSWANGFGSKLKTVKIPSTITALDAYSFYQAYFAELSIPDTVLTIGDGAFAKMSYLKTLKLPAYLTRIPAQMAANNEKLAKITIPAYVESIGANAFAGCYKLTSVTYKSEGALTTIEAGAFNSSGITKFTPPEGVTTIGENAAASCFSLTTVTLPSTVTTVGNYAFSGCEKLSKVTLNEGLTAIPEGMFMGCKKLSAVTIPWSVQSIGDYAFEGCTKVTITVYEGSWAHEWAVENNVPVKVKKIN